MQPMNKRLKEYIIPLAIIIVLLSISFWLQFKSCSSALNMSHEIWEQKLAIHQDHHPLNIRLLTTEGALLISRLTGFHFKESFIILQFVLAFLLGLSFYKFLRRLDFSPGWSNVGLFILLTSYPVMGAHFEPVHTWDDFWTYLFLVLTFSAILKRQFPAATIFFTISVFAREQSLLFYPIFIYGIILFRKESKLTDWFLIILPVILYLPYYFLNYQPAPMKRFGLIMFNFENSLRTKDSLFSIYISFGFIWITAIVELVTRNRVIQHDKDRLLYWGGIITTLLTLLLALFLTNIRETRILFPPFIFLIPLSLTLLKAIHNYIHRDLARKMKIAFLLFFHATMFVGILLMRLLIPRFEFRQCVNYCHEWGGINFGLAISILLIYILSRKLRLKFHNLLSERFKPDSFNNSAAA
jgi:hypothetical protein